VCVFRINGQVGVTALGGRFHQWRCSVAGGVVCVVSVRRVSKWLAAAAVGQRQVGQGSRHVVGRQ